MNLPMLPQDKANHMIYGACIALVCYLAARASPVSLGFVPVRAVPIIMAALAGAAKEALDWWANKQAAAAGQPPPHSVELNDALATLAGGVLVWAATA